MSYQSLEGATVMTLPNTGPTPAERAGDLDRIERALRAAVRDALLRHKRDGDPVAVWREGRVVWLQADDIPITPDVEMSYQSEHDRFFLYGTGTGTPKGILNMAQPETPPGQEKMHTLTRTNPETGETETMEISQADWKEQHKELQAAGWTRVDEDEPEDPVINPL